MPTFGADASTAPTSTLLPAATTGASAAASTSAPIDLDSVDSGDIVGFGLIEAQLGAENLVLAVADDSSLRARGLMGVTEFGDVDGMLFTWGGYLVSSTFTMRNTLVPLTVAFFDATGAVVDVLDMVPCDSEPCASYNATEPYTYAVEFLQGRAVPIGATLRFDQD